MRSLCIWLPQLWKDGNRNGEHYGWNKCGSLDQALYLMLSSQADIATTHYFMLLCMRNHDNELE